MRGAIYMLQLANNRNLVVDKLNKELYSSTGFKNSNPRRQLRQRMFLKRHCAYTARTITKGRL
jgi:hypothetical protein